MTCVLCDAPALRLAELIRRREVSSTEVVEAHMENEQKLLRALSAEDRGELIELLRRLLLSLEPAAEAPARTSLTVS